MKPKVLIASSSFEDEPEAYQVLEDAGYTLVKKSREERAEWGSAELITALNQVDAAILGGDYTLDAHIFKSLRNIKYISLNCTGYNHVDIAAAQAQGFMVCNMPGNSCNAVADFIFAQILGTMRQLVKGDKAIRNGQWNLGVEKSPEVYGKTLGIVGMGRIGEAVAKRAMGFDMPILAFDPFPKKEYETKYHLQYVSKEELVSQADIIALCCPLSENTYHLIDASCFASMKPTAYLVNSSRGAIVDEDALLHALQTESIAGAAIDVFSEEPLHKSPLFELDNVVLSPHLAGLADKQIKESAVGAAKNLVTLIETGTVSTIL